MIYGRKEGKKMNYDVKINPFRESGKISGYHEIYYNLDGNNVIFCGFKLHRKKYMTVGVVKNKLHTLLKAVCENNESRRYVEVVGLDNALFAGGNVIQSHLANHFSGRSLEAAREFKDLYKLGKLIFGIERVF